MNKDGFVDCLHKTDILISNEAINGLLIQDLHLPCGTEDTNLVISFIFESSSSGGSDPVLQSEIQKIITFDKV